MIEKIMFGVTGHLSTRTIFGGTALFKASKADADRTLEILFKYEVNHIDTAADYGDSEVLIGRWMRQYRDKFFLATKTSARSYKEAHSSILRSMERLCVDRLDLIQLHCLIDSKEWEQAMGPEGALKALVEARENKLASYIGVTAHGLEAPDMLLKSLRRFNFDSVLLPYNYPLMAIPEYKSGFEALVTECKIRVVAVQTIKTVARRLRSDDSKDYSTWYEPLMELCDIDKAVHWALAQPDFLINTIGDVNLLPKVLDAASRYVPGEHPSDEEMKEMVVHSSLEQIFPVA